MNHLDSSPRNYETVDKTQKILNLQDELLNVRKQMSKKQSQWQKQRNNLLSKNQVANIEIAELKQRIVNLTKINQTLSNAMTNQNEGMIIQKSQAKIKKPKPLNLGEVSGFNCEQSQGKKNTNIKYQEEVKKLNRIIAEKDYQISNLNKIGNELRGKIQERNSAYSILEETCFNLKRKIQKKEEEILKLHKQIQEIQQKLEENNQYIDETRRMSCQVSQAQLSKRALLPQDLEESEQAKKYQSKNSSYLMVRPTPDYPGYDMQSSQWNQINLSDPGYESEEEQKLLCEVCNRVFSFADFQEHVHTCGYKSKFKEGGTRHLFDKKRQIQTKLQKIIQQEQKQNLRGYYGKSDGRYDVDASRDKIVQIREIAKGLASNKGKKSPYNDFSIKSNFYY